MTPTFTQSIASKILFFIIASLFTVASANAATPGLALKVKDGVVYGSVNARTTEKSVIIDWKTLSEVNNNHFEVERSTDKVNFKTVAIVLDGFEGEGTGKIYSFKESISVLENAKVTYYRLKQIDAEGNSTYSALIEVAK
jgi:hypothetical protein